MFLKDDPALGYIFYCASCREEHWVPPPLMSLSDSAERYAEIERLWEAQDISRDSYAHWRHVILVLACHLAIQERLTNGRRE